MTFSLRRKHPTTPRAARLKRAATTLSALLLTLVFATSASAQSFITPKFIASPRSGDVENSHHSQGKVPGPNPLMPAAAQLHPPRATVGDDRMEPYVRTDLPGPQRLFLRQSETQFFDRIAQEVKRQGGARAMFPETPILSKEPWRPRAFPPMVEFVEPAYVCHGRLYFEQPNFERYGYDFGVLQPAMNLGVFYYDVFMFPYHAFSDLHNCTECNVGKCLPGDPAPMLWTPERFSVTGTIGQAAAIVGGLYLFPR